MGDDPVFNVLDQRRVDAGQRTGRQGQVLKAHAGQGIHHHVHHMVPVAEVVVDEYKDVYPLGEKEGELRQTLKNTFCGSLPQEHVKSWFEEWKKWSLNSTEKD